MKPVHFSEPASAELAAAVQWYEHRRLGLGAELFDRVTATIARFGLTQKLVRCDRGVYQAASSTSIDFPTRSCTGFAKTISTSSRSHMRAAVPATGKHGADGIQSEERCLTEKAAAASPFTPSRIRICVRRSRNALEIVGSVWRPPNAHQLR